MLDSCCQIGTDLWARALSAASARVLSVGSSPSFTLQQKEKHMNSPKGAVGIVGLGIMGGAIARNLAAAGWHVFGYDIEPARQKEAAAVGVKVEAGAAAVARQAPTIFTSLPN